MKLKNRIIAAVCTAAVAVTACGCSGDAGTNDTAAKNDHYNIGITKMMDHVALNASEEGFVAALADRGFVDGENITIDYQNGQGESANLNTIATQFAGNNVDLIFAIATPAAQAAMAQTETIPIIGTAITDYVEAGLVNSNEAPGTNVSGTTDMNPVSDQIDLMLELFPETKTIGFLYNSSEDNSILQTNIAKEYVESKGLAWVEKTVSNTNEVQQATTSIITECDAIYIPTDNIFASSMTIVGEICMGAGVPVVCGESGMVSSGGLATLGINYFDLGYAAGNMAADVLEGADVSTMAIKGSDKFDYAFNADFAEAIGFTIPEKYAEYVITAEAE